MLQVVFQFALQDRGWSEVHYTQQTDPSALINNAGELLAPLSDLWLARRRLMPFRNVQVNVINPGITVLGQNANNLQASADLSAFYNPRLERIRVSLVGPGNFRRVRIATFALPLQYGLWQNLSGGSASGSVPAETWSRLLVACNLSGNNNGHVWLGAVPEDQISPADNFTPIRSYLNNFNNWANKLISGAAGGGGGFGTRLRTYVNDPTTVVQPITAFTVSPNGILAQLTAPTLVPPLGAPTGQLIIRGRHPSQWNGVHRYQYVTVGVGAPFFEVGPSRQILADFSLSLGTVQLQVPQFVSYQALQPERLEHRDDGTPFFRPRGRRRRPV